jgi:signal transduction histidine kinase
MQPLVRLGQRLANDESLVTSQWMAAVLVDRQIRHSNSLTHSQLMDHLPAIYAELCELLKAQDLESSQADIRRDAKTHGYYRWSQGYELDEMVRELDVLRRILAAYISDFGQDNPDFQGTPHERALYLIDEVFSIVTTNSIRQAVKQKQDQIDDYTDRLERSNKELTQQQSRLQQLASSRLQLTRSVAHDLRNFLQVFATSLQIMRRDPAQASAALTLAERQTRDMGVLVDQLVDYAVVLGKDDDAAPQDFDIVELFNELAGGYRSIAEEKGLRFECKIDPALRSAAGDRVRIKQIAFNLLSNAVKYTDEGSITFCFEASVDDRWAMRVGDTGQGIEQADQQRVFEEFERGKQTDDTPGVGLGLAIVKELVADLGGTIHFMSQPGKGSVFEVLLPLGGNSAP